MSSKHPRQHTLPDGLFRGLSSFQELEARIARLPEPLERGDALACLGDCVSRRLRVRALRYPPRLLLRSAHAESAQGRGRAGGETSSGADGFTGSMN